MSTLDIWNVKPWHLTFEMSSLDILTSGYINPWDVNTWHINNFLLIIFKGIWQEKAQYLVIRLHLMIRSNCYFCFSALQGSQKSVCTHEILSCLCCGYVISKWPASVFSLSMRTTVNFVFMQLSCCDAIVTSYPANSRHEAFVMCIQSPFCFLSHLLDYCLITLDMQSFANTKAGKQRICNPVRKSGIRDPYRSDHAKISTLFQLLFSCSGRLFHVKYND